jgi:PAS domain S-box-containing protein
MNVRAEMVLQEDALLATGALQDAVFNSARLCCIATDEQGVIRLLSAGAEGMLGYAAADVRGKMFTGLCDPQELIAREALVCNASLGGEDIYALTYVRKNGSPLSATVAVTALRGDGDAITGYLLMGTDNTTRRDAEEALLALTATHAAAESKKPLALVIDDDDRAARVLRLFLEAEGFAVVHSISAEDALLEAPKHSLALITLDLQMYGMNGWQFLKTLRERGMLKDVPVIIASGRPAEDDLAQSRGAGAVLQKPIGRVQLKAALSKLGLLKIRVGF